MTDALETLARELEKQSRWADTIDRKWSVAYLAAAAACMETIARRTDPETMGYESMQSLKATEATDAALAAFMEGR
jgi:hypothetical protein